MKMMMISSDTKPFPSNTKEKGRGSKKGLIWKNINYQASYLLPSLGLGDNKFLAFSRVTFMK